MSKGRFSVFGVFGVQDRMTRPIQRMSRQFGRFGRGVNDGFDRAGQAVLGLRHHLLAAAAAAGLSIAGIVTALRDVVTTGAEFERTLASAAAKFPGDVRRGTEEFERLQAAAADVGATTEFTASQAAEGLDFLAMAGFNAQQAVAALPGVVDLATAAQMELGQATDIASDSLGAFGLMTEDSAQLGRNLARVNDVIARSTTSANMTVEQMFESIRTGGPTVTAAGQSMETFAAMTAAMADAGTKGAEAGTAIRTMMLRLQAPAAAGRRALRELGVEVENGDGNMRDMIDIVGDLRTAMDGMGSVQQARMMNQIFGQRAIGPANLLLQAGADSLREFRSGLEGAEGAAASMAGQMRDTTQGDLDSFTSAVEAVKLEIFEVVRGPLRQVVQAITGWIRANRDLISSGLQQAIEWLGDNMPTIVKWATRIGIAVGVLAVLFASSVAVFATGTALLGALIVGVVDLAATVIDWLAETGTAAADFIVSTARTMWESVSSFLTGAREFVVGAFVLISAAARQHLQPVFRFFEAAANRLRPVWEPVRDFFVAMWSVISSGASSAFSLLSSAASRAASALRAAWAPIAGFFSRLWSQIVDGFQSTVGPIIGMISGAIESVRAVGRNELDGDGGDGGRPSSPVPQVVGPEERMARTVSESVSREEQTVDIAVRAERGSSAEVRSRGSRLQPIRLDPSGAM
jgi:TP901 family phage tail tape measure protein